jgi:peptide/nickel transport system substrate-binding protein
MKKTAKKLLALLLVCILIAALAACGKTDNPDTNPDSSAAPDANPSVAPGDTPDASTTVRDTLNVAVSLDSGTLDPMNVTGAGGFLNVILTYTEPLFDIKADASFEMILCEKIDTVSDTQFTLHLRQGAKFSNGSDFKANDVLFSMNLERNHFNRFLDVQFVDWDKTTATDDYTIDLWFSQYTPMNLTKIAQMMILDEDTYDATANSTNPIGTGPYVVTDYVVNSHVTLEANPNYWGEQPTIKKINFKCLSEASQVTNALETGEVDFATMQTSDIEYIKGLGKYTIEEFFSGYSHDLYFNMSPDGKFANKDARLAVMFAMDTESMNEVAFSGYGELLGWPVSAHYLDYDPSFAGQDDVYKTGYNLEKAKALAESSGLAGQTIKVITNGAQMYIDMALVMQEDLGQIGVTVDIQNYDQASYYGMIADPSLFDIAMYGVSAPSMLASDVFANYPTFFSLGWEDSARNAYIAKGADCIATPDDAARAAKLKELVSDFYADPFWFGIVEVPSMAAVNNDVANFEYYLAGNVRFQNWAFTK